MFAFKNTKLVDLKEYKKRKINKVPNDYNKKTYTEGSRKEELKKIANIIDLIFKW